MRVIRIVALSLAGSAAVGQLIISIFDRILHVSFVAAALLFVFLLLMTAYAVNGDPKYKIIASAVVAVMISVPFASVFISPRLFVCQELFSGSIGFVSVELLGNDIYCISNGRPIANTKGRSFFIREYYIADRQRGRDALLNHYIKTVSSDTVCQMTKGGNLFFYSDSGSTLVATARVYHMKGGYDVLEVNAVTAYKYKNLLGGGV